MISRVIIRANRYYDSVSLMSVSQQVTELAGVEAAVVAMGTDMNKELLQNVGLMTPETAATGPSDLIIAIGAVDEGALGTAMERVEGFLKKRVTPAGPGSAGKAAPKSIGAAVRADPEANLALVSVPGSYAAREARLALEQGLHVMLYSDNVPLEAEISLKRLAHEKSLLLMGPDCGTAILGGVGLGFANEVRRGPIGIVAASGTGAQEISTLIDKLGSGVSHLIGVGGRDLSPQVGGIMMMDGIRILQEDPETEAIVLMSKPPAPEVLERVLAFASASGSKPVQICILGRGKDVVYPMIDEAALYIVEQVTGADVLDLAPKLGYGTIEAREHGTGRPLRVALIGHDGLLPTFSPGSGRRYVRGLFSGGTLCDQALLTLEHEMYLGPVVTCNVHPDPSRRGGAWKSVGHTLVDLGDDEFTRGRPHPMIDMTLRRMRILEEAADPETAAILLDIVLGHGAHADPAGALAGAISHAVALGVAVVTSVTGTEADPQRLSTQVETLQRAGAMVLPTARQAAEVVAFSLKGR